MDELARPEGSLQFRACARLHRQSIFLVSPCHRLAVRGVEFSDPRDVTEYCWRARLQLTPYESEQYWTARSCEVDKPRISVADNVHCEFVSRSAVVLSIITAVYRNCYH